MDRKDPARLEVIKQIRAHLLSAYDLALAHNNATGNSNSAGGVEVLVAMGGEDDEPEDSPVRSIYANSSSAMFIANIAANMLTGSRRHLLLLAAMEKDGGE